MSRQHDRPLVSVVIPTRNYARYLAGAVESTLQQRYERVETIVVDDGSTDETAEVLAAFSGRLRVERLTGVGVSRARNRGLDVARGDFVIFLDADDLLLPDAAALQVARFRSEPTLDAVYGSWYVADVRSGQWWLARTRHDPARLLPDLLEGNVVVTPSAIMLRRSTAEAVGGFDPAVSFTADWDLWLRLALGGARFGKVIRPVAVYRVHGESMSRDVAQAVRDVWHTLGKIFAGPSLPPSVHAARGRAYAHMGLYAAKLYLQAGDVPGALRELRHALSHDRRLSSSPWLFAELFRTIARRDGAGREGEAVAMALHLADQLAEAVDGAPPRPEVVLVGMALGLRLRGKQREALHHLRAATRRGGARVFRPEMLPAVVRICLPPAAARFWRGVRRRLTRAGSHNVGAPPALVAYALEAVEGAPPLQRVTP